MNEINGKKTENGYTLLFSGRVDSSNAADAEAAATALRRDNPEGELTIDAENLAYISSAGLRILLRLRKQEPSLRIVGVQPDVYEILEMTGFTEMMDVEKAYRRFSVDGCEIIGWGSNGTVYRLDPDTIIKVYNNPDSLADIHRERELARKAFVMGIPTAIPYDVAKVGDKYGSVFELLNAKSFAKLIKADPGKVDDYIGLYVDLLRQIHETMLRPGELPAIRQQGLAWAEYLRGHLEDADAEKLYSLIESIPDTDNMLHCDFHVKNVMLQNGEVLLIDMDTISQGHPVFEFAAMYLAYVGFGAIDPKGVEDFLGIPYDVAGHIWRRTLELYFGTDDPAVLQCVEDKAKVIGFARMMRRTIKRYPADDPYAQKLIAFCRVQLHDLLARTQTLTF